MCVHTVWSAKCITVMGVCVVFFRGGQVYNLDVINEEAKKKKKKYTNSGTLNFKAVR